MRSLKILLTAFAASLLISGTAAAQTAGPVKIRLAWVVPVSNWASILKTQQELGFLKAALDAKKHADLGIVQEAARRLR